VLTKEPAVKRILLGLILSTPRTLASDGFVWAEPSPRSEINHKLAVEQAVAAHLGTIDPTSAPVFGKVIRAFGVEDTIPAQQGFDSISILVSTSPDALRWLCKIELTLGNVDWSVKLSQQAATSRIPGRRSQRCGYE
jgi:hypothetical protein